MLLGLVLWCHILNVSAVSLGGRKEGRRLQERVDRVEEKAGALYAPQPWCPYDVCLAQFQPCLPQTNTPAQCNEALAQIISQPSNVAAVYMKQVIGNIYCPIYQWFTQDITAVAQQFQAANLVGISITDAFGNLVVNLGVDGVPQTISYVGQYKDMSFGTMRSYALNLQTFSRDEGELIFSISQTIYYPRGQMYVITLWLPLSKLPAVF